MKRLLRPIALCVPLLCSFGAHAEIGTIDEVVESAQKGKEPEYIKAIAFELLVKLTRFADAKKVSTLEESAALLYTIHVLNVGYKFAESASGRDFAQFSGWSNAANIIGAMSSFLQDTATAGRASAAASNAARDFNWESATSVAKTLAAERVAIIPKINNGARVYQDIEDVGIPYRVVEWSMLNFLLANFSDLLEKSYADALRVLNERPSNSAPFGFFFGESWSGYRTRNLDSIAGNIFLQPWIAVMNIVMKNRCEGVACQILTGLAHPH